MNFSISEVQIVPIKPNNGLVAFASFLLNEELYLGSIGIHSKLGGGYRLTFPTKAVGDRDLHIYHPTTRELSLLIEHEVIERYQHIAQHQLGTNHA